MVGLDHAIAVCGWSLVAAWAFGYYPQIIMQWKRKSVVGLALDYIFLNIVGAFCFALFSYMMIYNPTVRGQWMHEGPVRMAHVFHKLSRVQGNTVHTDDRVSLFEGLMALPAPSSGGASGGLAGGVITKPPIREALQIIPHEMEKAVHEEPATIQDLIFGLHSFFACGVVLFQVYLYRDKGYIPVSPPVMMFVFILIGSYLMVAAFTWFGITGLSALHVVAMLGFIKDICSFLKYIPQVVVNYRNQRTSGLAMPFVFCDFMGGFMCVTQQVLISVKDQSTSPLLDNVPKLLLGLESMIFTSIFFCQAWRYRKDSSGEMMATPIRRTTMTYPDWLVGKRISKQYKEYPLEEDYAEYRRSVSTSIDVRNGPPEHEPVLAPVTYSPQRKPSLFHSLSQALTKHLTPPPRHLREKERSTRSQSQQMYMDEDDVADWLGDMMHEESGVQMVKSADKDLVLGYAPHRGSRTTVGSVDMDGRSMGRGSIGLMVLNDDSESDGADDETSAMINRETSQPSRHVQKYWHMG